MEIHAAQILSDFKPHGILDAMTGSDTLITGIAPIEKCGPGDLVFVEKAELVQAARLAKPSAVVTTSELLEHLTDMSECAVFTSSNVRLAQALLRQAYVDRDLYQTEWPRIHPAAIIHESVMIPDDAVIGPGVVLGLNVRIGQRVVIMANTVVEENVQIDDETVLHPNVVIGYNCEIGKRCIIKSGCVVGMEGFGFAQDERRKSYRIPQTGKVVIEDDVVLGANCTLDRATFAETRICSGVKMDTLCHIAHNVKVDEDVIIASQSNIAGSTYIGKRVLMSGQTGVLDHLTISDDVVLLQRAGVISDIDKPGMYAGHPLQPLRQYFKNASLLMKLADMKKRLERLEKNARDNKTNKG
jgi:UDP-3-O-[3-hydroxymyristoyl] glucosamine N-acyltransferase